jgi:hypothetical protein
MLMFTLGAGTLVFDVHPPVPLGAITFLVTFPLTCPLPVMSVGVKAAGLLVFLQDTRASAKAENIIRDFFMSRIFQVL